MGLFKKKEKTVVTEYVCPAVECAFSANDNASLQRHIDWKHPDLSSNTRTPEKPASN